MKRSTNNAFTIGFCTLTGTMRQPAKLTPYQRSLQRAATAKQRRELTTAFAKNGISIPKLEDYDNRRGMRRAAI